jgi:hypothetical protein
MREDRPLLSNQRLILFYVRRERLEMKAVPRFPISVSRHLLFFMAAKDRFHLVF